MVVEEGVSGNGKKYSSNSRNSNSFNDDKQQQQQQQQQDQDDRGNKKKHGGRNVNHNYHGKKKNNGRNNRNLSCISCFGCGMNGHKRNFCPNKNNMSINGEGTEGSPAQHNQHEHVAETSEERFHQKGLDLIDTPISSPSPSPTSPLVSATITPVTIVDDETSLDCLNGNWPRLTAGKTKTLPTDYTPENLNGSGESSSFSPLKLKEEDRVEILDPPFSMENGNFPCLNSAASINGGTIAPSVDKTLPFTTSDTSNEHLCETETRSTLEGVNQSAQRINDFSGNTAFVSHGVDDVNTPSFSYMNSSYRGNNEIHPHMHASNAMVPQQSIWPQAPPVMAYPYMYQMYHPSMFYFVGGGGDLVYMGDHNAYAAGYDNNATAGYNNNATAVYDNNATAGYNNNATAGYNNNATADYNNNIAAGYDHTATANYDSNHFYGVDHFRSDDYNNNYCDGRIGTGDSNVSNSYAVDFPPQDVDTPVDLNDGSGVMQAAPLLPPYEECPSSSISCCSPVDMSPQLSSLSTPEYIHGSGNGSSGGVADLSGLTTLFDEPLDYPPAYSNDPDVGEVPPAVPIPLPLPYRDKSESSTSAFENRIYNSESRSRMKLPMYGPQNMESPVTKNRVLTPAGLRNLGNTCFMSSVMQCLAHIPEFIRCFANPDFLNQLNHENRDGHSGRVAEATSSLLRTMWCAGWSKTKARFVAPSAFCDMVRECGHEPLDRIMHEQQDAQEFLGWLMDALHEDLNTITKKPYREELYDWTASDYWSYEVERNCSVIFNALYLQTLNVRTCLLCKNVRTKYQAANMVVLPIPRTRTRTVTLSVVYYDTERCPLNMRVRTAEDVTVPDVLKEITKVVHVPASQLVLATVNSDQITILPSCGTRNILTDPIAGDRIVAFEVPPGDGWVHVRLLVRQLFTPEWQQRRCGNLKCSSNINFSEARSSKKCTTDSPLATTSNVCKNDDSQGFRCQHCKIVVCCSHSCLREHRYDNTICNNILNGIGQSLCPPILLSLKQEDISNYSKIESVALQAMSRYVNIDLARSLKASDPNAFAVTKRGPAVNSPWVSLERDAEKYAREADENGPAKTSPWGVADGTASDKLTETLLKSHLSTSALFKASSKFPQLAFDWLDYVAAQCVDIDAAKISDPDSSILDVREDKLDLHSCFRLFQANASTDDDEQDDKVMCSHCSDETPTRHDVRISRLPKILFMQLNRFKTVARTNSILDGFSYANLSSRSHHRPSKIETSIDFPLSGLDLSNFCDRTSVIAQLRAEHRQNSEDGICDSDNYISEDMQLPLYDLIGVVNHYGTMNYGHYTAFVKADSPEKVADVSHIVNSIGNESDNEDTLEDYTVSPPCERWFACDDETVSSIDEASVLERPAAAYILVYRRKDY